MQTKRMILALVVLIGVVAAAVYLADKSGDRKEVVVLCGGSMRAMLEQIIEEYKSESTDVVLGTYGGSGELCVQIREGNRCDVYVCHDPFMPWAAEQGLIADWKPMAYLDLAIVIRKDDPKTAGVKTLTDLARPGLRVGIGHKKLSTSGVIVKELLRKLPQRDALLANVAMETKGHQGRCTAVAIGTLDAALVWEPVGLQFADKLKVIPIRDEYSQLIDTLTSATYKESDLRNVQVTVGLTTISKDKPEAKRFYEFLLKRGPVVLKAKGFRMPTE